MMWVRYPNGQVIQYNKAMFLEQSGDWTLFEKQGGRCICVIQASAGAIVELEKACSTENPLDRNFDQQRLANDLSHTARQLRLAIKDLNKKK